MGNRIDRGGRGKRERVEVVEGEGEGEGGGGGGGRENDSNLNKNFHYSFFDADALEMNILLLGEFPQVNHFPLSSVSFYKKMILLHSNKCAVITAEKVFQFQTFYLMQVLGFLRRRKMH